jgi:NAD(P)-dependent dehydrogenase (short-subunit alcohol dehydrogenase family)
MQGLFDLQSRVAVVTGAAQGLGRGIAQALAAHGAAVILADRDTACGESAAANLRAQGLDALAIGCDVAETTDIERLIDTGSAWRGRIDIVVCNAGVAGPSGPSGEVDDAAWQRVFDVNLRGAARLCQALIPAMAARGSGSVILMSSIAGLRGNTAIGLYGLSKAALAQLARNLAVEWGPHGVRVNAISPGLIRTPLSTRLMADAAFMQRRLAMTPLRRVGEVHEVAGVAVLLASRAGAFITGQNIVVDGGTLISDGG